MRLKKRRLYKAQLARKRSKKGKFPLSKRRVVKPRITKRRRVGKKQILRHSRAARHLRLRSHFRLLRRKRSRRLIAARRTQSRGRFSSIKFSHTSPYEYSRTVLRHRVLAYLPLLKKSIRENKFAKLQKLSHTQNTAASDVITLAKSRRLKKKDKEGMLLQLLETLAVVKNKSATHQLIILDSDRAQNKLIRRALLPEIVGPEETLTPGQKLLRA